MQNIRQSLFSHNQQLANLQIKTLFHLKNRDNTRNVHSFFFTQHTIALSSVSCSQHNLHVKANIKSPDQIRTSQSNTKKGKHTLQCIKKGKHRQSSENYNIVFLSTPTSKEQKRNKRNKCQQHTLQPASPDNDH